MKTRILPIITSFLLWAILLLWQVDGFAQNTVSGVVKDSSTDATLPGVNVIVKGTQQGTSTDSMGNYSLEVSSLQDTLIFSFIGFQTKEIPVNGRTTINVVLQSQTIAGEELVVVGYGAQQKATVSGSVSGIEEAQLTQAPVANASELLAGTAAGLITRQNNSVPGSDFTNFSIRGFDNPLVLVDGVERSFTRLDPNNIESISVLKDASAAIYGARAGNGVILVTTKRGQRGKPQITYQADVSTQQPTALPNRVNAPQFVELYREGELNYGLQPKFSEEELEKYQEGTEPGYQSYDWYDAVMRDWTPMQKHTLSVEGGTDEVRYYISTGFLDQASVFTSGDLNFQRHNALSNIDADITDNLTASLDLSYRREYREEPGQGLGEIFVQMNTAQPINPPRLIA